MDRFANTALPSSCSKTFPAFWAGAAVTHTAGPGGKRFVVVALPKGFGRIRLRQFIQDSIEPDSIVRTDGSGSYAKLHELGYQHERTVMLGSDIPAHVSMAGVHRVASFLQRWILGTHPGSIQPEHLDAYLDEFVVRFNRRASGSRGMLFYRLLQQALVTDPVTYADVIRPTSEPLVAQDVL